MVQAKDRTIVKPPKKPGTSSVARTNTIRPVAKPGTNNSPSPSIAATQPAATSTATPSPSIMRVAPVANPVKKFSANLVTKDPLLKTRTVTVTASESFNGILTKLGFNQRQIANLSQRLAREAGFVTTSARAGQQIILTEKIEGNKRKLLGMQIPTDKYVIKISKSRTGYIQINRDIRKDAPSVAKSRYFYKTGVIQTSFAAYSSRLSVPQAVNDKAVRVLASKINVNQSHRGAKLDLLYEYTYNNAGQQTGLRLLYLNFAGKAGRVEGFRFAPDGRDTGEFFDINGLSFTKSMLASPLRGRHRITSPYGYRRHPILGRSMLHTGVDFGARRGEPVYAAGDGTIDKIGRYGGYGNFIRIKHDGTWSTAYAHMNGYARGMYKWKRVRKGEQIGYVGSTGRSTGPHLHFELQQYGKPIDPLRAKLPVGGKKLIAKDLYNFRQEANRIRNLISSNKR